MDSHFDHRSRIDNTLAIPSPTRDVFAAGSNLPVHEVVPDGGVQAH